MRPKQSLDADYFDGIFGQDDDPWDLASSGYEDAKFAESLAALADRRYTYALEVGCAHGVLTQKLAPLCDHLLATDISNLALAKARERIGPSEHVTFEQMAFPKANPNFRCFDLVLLSEVAYYWDAADLRCAGRWLKDHMVSKGHVLLVHYVGETDYPQTGDDAVELLGRSVQGCFDVETATRHDCYRLDLWVRR